jgi:hypothetical protein
MADTLRSNTNMSVGIPRKADTGRKVSRTPIERKEYISKANMSESVQKGTSIPVQLPEKTAKNPKYEP